LVDTAIALVSEGKTQRLAQPQPFSNGFYHTKEIYQLLAVSAKSHKINIELMFHKYDITELQEIYAQASQNNRPLQATSKE
jgi:hypothetical protein